MKNAIKWFSIIALVAVIGFSFASCSGKEDPETDFVFERSGDGAEMIITLYKGKNVNVVVPAKIQGLPVVQLRGFGGYRRIFFCSYSRQCKENQ
jgi:hypothetical protein